MGRTIPVLMLLAIILGGCASSPQDLPRSIPVAALPKEEVWGIIDYKDSRSAPLPEWVDRYLRGGVRLVEEMPEFADRAVFVSEDEGVSFSALERRRVDFDPLLDFPHLAALRVSRRLTALGGNNPDREFSRYHETAVRAAAGTAWSGVRREDDFWLTKSFAGEAGETEEREAYVLLILLTVDREYFRNTLDEMLWRQAETPEAGREQAVLIRRIRNIFYAEF
jgi:hypothetical protein